MSRAAGGVVLAVVCAAGVFGLHRAFVLSTTGQALDDATLVGGSFGEALAGGPAEAVLSVVSVVGLAVASAAVLLIGVLRRRVRRAVLAVVLVAGPTLTTQLLKDVVLDRPALAETAGAAANSLPSGHTTVAAAVAAAVLVVLPPRLRPLGAVAGAVVTIATGVATLVLGWHRASDVVAGVLVVGAWTGAVAAVISLRDLVTPLREAGPAAPSGWRLVVPGLGVVAGAASAAAVAVVLVLVVGPLPVEDRTSLLVAGGGAVLAITGVSCAVFLAALLALRPLPRPPTGWAHSPAPDRPVVRTGGPHRQ